MFVDNAVPVAPLLVRYKKSQVNQDNHMMLHSAVPINSNQLGKSREGQKARPGLTQHRKISQDGAGESEEVMNYPASHSVRRCYEFGPFQLNTLARLLLHEGREVPLTPKLFDTLLLLVEHCGEVVEREDFIRVVWPDTYVEEGNLSTNIYALRKALGDDRRSSPYIATVPRRGYRFTAMVRRANDTRETRNSPPVRTIAVLPFKPLGCAAAESHLELGLADALITRLSNFRQIIVRPTSAVRRFSGLDFDPVQVGQELDADAVVDGSLQCAGQRLRATAQLISVSERVPLWAAQFDEQLTDPFTVEDVISERMVEALKRNFLSERPQFAF